MFIEDYKKRIIDDKIKSYLEVFGSMVIEGPKWCGKTWSAKNACNSEFLVADPKNNFNNKQIALLNPDLVLEGEQPRLIDEWQEAPLLWDAVRGKVDNSQKKGQFVLTGSASIDKSKYIHSGTGRIAHLRMRPMSLYEKEKSEGKVSLKDICYGKAKDCLTKNVTLGDLIDLVLSGGWPSTFNLDVNQSRIVAKEYINSLISEDLYKIDEIKRDKHKFELLLRSLARNESTIVTNKTLKNDVKEKDNDDIDVDTIADYLDVLNKLFITENIPPYSARLRSSLRVKQSEKRHFVDPSLPCALLNLTKDKLINDLEFFGFLFESMVERDLLTYVDSFGDAKLFHYQDYNNNEIDAVIELEDSSWCGIEIKLGSNQIDEAAANLIKINSEIIKEGGTPAKSLCVICGLVNAAYMRDDGVYVVPFTSLKN